MGGVKENASEATTSTNDQAFKMPDLSSLSRGKGKGRDKVVHHDAETTEVSTTQGPEDPIPEAGFGNVDLPQNEAHVSDSANGKHGKAFDSKLASYDSVLSQLKSKYTEPEEAIVLDSRYGFEVLRNGSIIDKIQFKTDSDRSFYVVGRLPQCDITGEHPTISRIHAVLQFMSSSKDQRPISGEDPETKGSGLYVYDLNSTHGTFLNKNQVFPARYYRLRVGHVLKFGNSTRLYVLCGPDEDAEEESEKSVTELMQERNEKELKRKFKSGLDDADDDDDRGVTWGMADDAVEEAGLSVNPFALDIEDTNELCLDNPKRSLQSWFEREGYDLVYDVSEKSSGHFICTINLPLDSANGTPVIAEVDGKGKKKEIMAQCALKACQILDKYGVLRKSNQESHSKRKSRDWEEKDYYSSDEDTFLDRTGSVERKRKFRMKQAGKIEEKAETYETLNAQYTDVSNQLEQLEAKMAKAKQRSASLNETADPLDEFMQDVKSGVTDIPKMKSEAKRLKEEQERLMKLINLTKPDVKTISPAVKKSGGKVTTVLFGPRKGVIPPKKLATQTAIPTAAPLKPTSSSSSPGITMIDLSEPETTENVVFDSAASSTLPSCTTEGKAMTGLLELESELQEEPRSSLVPEVTKVSPSDLNESEVDPGSKTGDRKRRRRPQKKLVSYEYDSTKPEYSVWVPPTDQTGDGKTKLNEKLGY